MTYLAQSLNAATKTLEQAYIPTARLDSMVLLEDVTGKDRAWLLAHPELILQGVTLQKYNSFIERRAKHEPLAYIRGKSEFYGREFLVTPSTLQPRPETETMITLLKSLLQHDITVSALRARKYKKDVLIVDVGTGSGCLAITAKIEWPEIEVYATEINEDALKIAKKNATKLGADVKFYQGNLLEPIYVLRPPLFALLCNLPYVPDSHPINKAAKQEPKIAIFGGEDGLDLYRDLFKQVQSEERRAKSEVRPSYILTESLPFQHTELAKIAKQQGYKLVQTEDFIQVFIAHLRIPRSS